MVRLDGIRIGTVACVLAGVCMTFPAPLRPGAMDGGWPRMTDLLNLICFALLIEVLLRGGMLHGAIRLVALTWALSFVWIVVELWFMSAQSDGPVQRLLIRWLMAGFSAYWILVLMNDRRRRYLVAAGQLAGVVLSLGTVAMDWATFTPEDMPVDELVKLAIYNGKDIHDFVYRAFGIFGHPNGAAGCVLLGVPILIGIVDERKASSWWLLAALPLMAATFYLTKSRAPLVISCGLLMFWFVRHGASWERLCTLGLGAAAAGLVLVVLMGGIHSSQNVLLQRFMDTESITVNADDRWWTIITAFDLLLRNPLGLGSSYVDPLNAATGTTATHNAYLELGLMGGVPLTLFVIVRLVTVARWIFAGQRSIESWMAAYLLCIFSFEAYFLQLNILVVVFWLVAATGRPRGGRRSEEELRARLVHAGRLRSQVGNV
jgi:hypothetical protein